MDYRSEVTIKTILMKNQNLLIKPHLLNPNLHLNKTDKENPSVTALPAASTQVFTDWYRAKAIQYGIVGNLFNDLKQSHNVIVTLSPVNDKEKAIINCKGSSKDHTDFAAKAIEKVIGTLNLELIDTTREILDYLFASSITKEKSLGHMHLSNRLSNFRGKENGVCVVRSNSDSFFCAIAIVFVNELRDQLPRFKAEILDIISKSHFESERQAVPRVHVKSTWNDTTCGAIEELLDGECKIFFRRGQSKGQEAFLELWGSEKGRSSARKLIEEFYDPITLRVPDECAQPMMQERCKFFQDLQKDVGVSLQFSKFEQVLYIYGLTRDKENAKQKFDEFVKNTREYLKKYVIAEIELKPEEIGAIIGQKGKTIRSIIDRSACYDIRISDSTLKVTLIGDKNNVAHAKELIEHELNTFKSLVVVHSPFGELEAKDISKTDSKGPTLGARGDEEWIVEEKSENEKPVDTNDTEIFPVLGARLGNAGKKKSAKFAKHKK